MYTNIKTKIGKVNNDTLATLGMRVIDTVNESGIEEALTSKQFQKLMEVNAEYQQSTNPINVKLMSIEVNNKFLERNKLFLEMFTYIKGLTFSDDTEMREAAQKIYEELTKFGTNFSNIRLADKTMRYIRIIESLQQPEMAEAVLTTQLTAKLAKLYTVQREYEDLYMGKGNRVAGKVTPTSIRKRMGIALKKHLEETGFLYEKYETEAWKTLYTNLNKRFDEVSIAQTSEKKDDQKAPDENPLAGAAS